MASKKANSDESGKKEEQAASLVKQIKNSGDIDIVTSQLRGKGSRKDPK